MQHPEDPRPIDHGIPSLDIIPRPYDIYTGQESYHRTPVARFDATAAPAKRHRWYGSVAAVRKSSVRYGHVERCFSPSTMGIQGQDRNPKSSINVSYISNALRKLSESP